jgi:mRNA-degrading endonuclease RelE of RelBE toxin-antitoxin system
MAYRVEVGPRASIQLEKLNATVLSAVERKIIWLAQNAAVMVPRRLVGIPED